jgi:hypothetical protein
MKKLIVVAALAVLATPALADTYTYACKINDETTHGNDWLFAAKLDFGNHTLTWGSTVYRNLKQVTDNCAKDCYEATDKKTKFWARLDMATQGAASLTIAGGTSGADGMISYDCDLVRP